VLKITEQRGTEPDSLSLLLEGRLAGPWVEQLSAYCCKMSEEHQYCTVIDLTSVTFIDASGKALLASLWKQGAELRASGCLTKSVVEEITEMSRTDPSIMNRDTCG
jgi:anti-anti-sigma regulatory factor